jgi:hypothetical protein
MKSFKPFLIPGLLLWCVAFALPQRSAAQFAPSGAGMTATQPHPIFQINFTRLGPYPTTYTRPTGPFVFAIRPHWVSLGDTYTLQLQAPAGATTAQPALVQFLAGQHHYIDYQQINLLPGVYQVVFSNHPAWTVTLTITN